MSYCFAIIGTQDNPLFEHEFGTSKQGGDGQPRFTEPARHLNQFILHSSLDIVEEVQWTGSQLYFKAIDKFFTSYISLFLTGSNTKFLLLHQPSTPSPSSSSTNAPGTTTRVSSTSIGANPTSPATEEAVRSFFVEVYENYTKAVMSPFYRTGMEIRSPVFRARVAAAGRKYL
ncbi:transport protein particle 20 kDa subunit [Podospora conica]|nr:transport protein particle 20 kDa subunit [Schizothecium conicum]